MSDSKNTASFQQTMIRIKDPAVSVPFYENHFGMKLVHRYDFNQWGFSVYFLETQRASFTNPTFGADSEQYLWSMPGTTLELTHNHGSENNDDFSVWNGNTGGDGSGDLKAESPAFRGFGHIAFNVDDVYAACEELEKNGVRFHKRPNEGRMKGLAFALDPDGYWIEIVRRQAGIFDPVSEKYNLSQTMMRVKNGPASLAFYRDIMGMTCVRQMDFPQWGFSLYFMAQLTADELAAAFALLPEEERKDHGDTLDPLKPNSMSKVLWKPCLELTWNHGTENDENMQVHTGNTEPHRGFGHIGFIVDDLDAFCADIEAKGVAMKKRPSEGGMRGLAFAYDPDQYWIELIQKGGSFDGVCAPRTSALPLGVSTANE
jgi:lactoylglutathione lyase